MTFPQTLQTLGFFWLAATGLFLSIERIRWGGADFIAPGCALGIYLVGRSHLRWYVNYEPSRIILTIGAVAVGCAAFLGNDGGPNAANTSVISLILGGSVLLVIGSKLRRNSKNLS